MSPSLGLTPWVFLLCGVPPHLGALRSQQLRRILLVALGVLGGIIASNVMRPQDARADRLATAPLVEHTYKAVDVRTRISPATRAEDFAKTLNDAAVGGWRYVGDSSMSFLIFEK